MLPPIAVASTPRKSRKQFSLRFQLLSAVNVVLLAGLAVVLVFDYRSETTERLGDKQTALHDEAALLLPMLERLRHQGHDVVEEYITAACNQMQETTSPGHHIAVTLGNTTLQAQTHHVTSPNAYAAMKAGSDAADHQAEIDGQRILVGSAARGDLGIYVSEYVRQVLQASRRQIIERSVRIGLLGLAGMLIADWVLVRVLVRPLDRLVAVVRRIGGGDLGTQAHGFGSAEFQFLADEVNSMSTSLAAVEADRSRQMEKARAIQQRLHPTATSTAGWRIASLYRPADEVGGDYFDLRVLDERLLAICIADVTGHGVSAAMGAAMLKTLFDSAVEQTHDPAQILHRINRGFLSVSLDGDFASMTVAVLDQGSGRVRYANAGHEPGYLLTAGGCIAPLDGTGFLLGIEPAAQWDVAELEVGPGDQLVLLTDGWAETATSDGRLLGREPLQATLREAAGLGPEQAVRQMVECINRVGEGRRQADDLTLLVAQWPIQPDANAATAACPCAAFT